MKFRLVQWTKNMRITEKEESLEILLRQIPTTKQWRIYGGGARDACPPGGSKFFQFHAVFGKIWQNRMMAPLRGVGAPSSGKSWIRHCKGPSNYLFHGNIYTFLRHQDSLFPIVPVPFKILVPVPVPSSVTIPLATKVWIIARCKSALFAIFIVTMMSRKRYSIDFSRFQVSKLLFI